MKSLLTASFVICAGSLFAATAYAGPVEQIWHSRENSIGIEASGWEDVSGGSRSSFMRAEEYYDARGTYEYSELYLLETIYLETGLGFRSLRCPLESGVVKVLGDAHAASFETTVDVDTAGCELWGYWYDYESGYETSYGYSGMIHAFISLTGRHSKTSSNRKVTRTDKDGYVQRDVCTYDSAGGFDDARVEINGVSLGQSLSAIAHRDACLYSAQQK